ncbi:MAG TPA: FtsX-like permease family protein [Cyclobacteriaceae bacterium]|nr:FtsX-like permease family protein [Cyclobacteriaceae bacterium]
MLFNYILLAFRNLRKQRGYTIVNTLGLAIGLASALFIFMYVRDELTFDGHHPHAAQTYRLGYRIDFPNGDNEGYPAAPAGWDNYIKDNFPGVTHISSFESTGMPTSLKYVPADRTLLTEEIIWAESNIAELLNIKVVKGDRSNPLKEINSIMVSEKAAKELFGNEDPINKMISVSHTYSTRGNKIEMMVTAVYEDFPANTHVHPDFIVNILAQKPYVENLETLLSTSMGDGENNYWTQSLFVCTNEAQIPLIQEDLQKRANQIIARFNLEFKFTPLIRKITDVHFDQDIAWGISHKSADKKYTLVFVTIALLILVVACINYVNLSTARSAARAKEIGLRKTFGGFRFQLFAQFMTESFLLVMMSAILALLLVALFIPQFNQLAGKLFTVSDLFDPAMLGIILGVILFVTLLAGSYPAIFVSGFQPANVLKGKFEFRKGSIFFRQFLTTVQFVVAVTLLVGTVIVVRQMDMMRNSKLNEAGKQIVSIRYGGFTGDASDQKYLAYKNAVLQDPEIEAMTLANHLPRLDFFGPVNMNMQFPEISEERHEWFQLNGDYDFPKTFKMNIIAGRDFDHANLGDSTAILLNESAARSLKLTPSELVGKTVIRPEFVMGYSRPDSTKAPITGIVIGVVEDFPYRSMHRKIDPLAICPKPHTFDRIIHVRLPATSMGEKIALLEKKWKEIYPDFGFDYWFVDEEFGHMYENEVQVAGLTEKFSGLAILITCVGLYGLASFLSEQRTKEIGIRKTLGASNGQILVLLLTVFAKLLLIACIIGVPVAWYLSSQWLESFVYQTPLGVMVFATAVGMIVMITLLTVGYESLKASLANPVKALKHE